MEKPRELVSPRNARSMSMSLVAAPKVNKESVATTQDLV
jgi:hypothetical protein